MPVKKNHTVNSAFFIHPGTIQHFQNITTEILSLCIRNAITDVRANIFLCMMLSCIMHQKKKKPVGSEDLLLFFIPERSFFTAIKEILYNCKCRTIKWAKKIIYRYSLSLVLQTRFPQTICSSLGIKASKTD